jgi:hypothetical protein
VEQRHPAQFSAFSMDREGSCDPIDIVEFESTDFSGVQPKTREQQQNRVVSSSGFGPLVAARQDTPHLIGSQMSWNAHKPAVRRAWNCY